MRVMKETRKKKTFAVRHALRAVSACAMTSGMRRMLEKKKKKLTGCVSCLSFSLLRILFFFRLVAVKKQSSRTGSYRKGVILPAHLFRALRFDRFYVAMPAVDSENENVSLRAKITPMVS